jgi:N-ethylmaleimide reductase
LNKTLFDEYQLGPITLKNRIVMAPLTRGRAGEDRIPNDIMATYYSQRATAGLIISEATTISRQANGWNESPGIYTDGMEEQWKKVVESVHESGGKIFLQLWHCGRASHSDFHGGAPAVAPSAIKIDNGEQIRTPHGKKPHEIPRALETHEVELVVEDYRAAAQRAKRAGFDGVEIHSANGYLIDTFLQSKTNQRDDKYGGSIEKRYTFLDEIVNAVCSVWPSRQVGVRLSPNGVFNDMGSPDFREQFTYVAGQLDQYDLAYIHVMDGLGFGFHQLGEPVTLSELRKVYSGTLMGNCGYDRQSAELQIEQGNADLIAFGRPFISNPDLVARFKNEWPLNEEADMSTWYAPTGAKGYIDFPVYHENRNAELQTQTTCKSE